MSFAKLSENMDKNRYKDVLPCKFLLMSKMTHLFLPDRQNYVSIKLIQISGKAIITLIMVCVFFPYMCQQSVLQLLFDIFRFFLFSMSKRVFESKPESLHCFVIMIELCYDYRCKALRREWITVIVKCIFLFYCV